MPQVRQDNVQIKLEIDGSQSRTELDNLTRKAQVLQDGLKGLKKGSEEYVAQSAELSQVRTRMGELQDEIGITGLSYAQLGTLSRQLGRELYNLVPATEAYVAKATELGKVQARMDELRAGIKSVAEAFGKAAEVDFTKLRDEVGLVGLNMDQLGDLVKQLNGELAELTPGTAEFVAKSKELNQAEARLAEVREQARGVGEELEQSGTGFLDFVKKAAGFAGIQLGIEAVVDGLRDLGRESIKAAVEGSDAIADMEKSLNVTTGEAKNLRIELGKIDTRTSQENLEGIAIAAGQLGITKDQVVSFTTAVDQAVVALGDEFTGGVEEVTKSLGGLQKLFKETKDVSPAEAITKIGSAVNALGADGQATGPVIADFTSRIGQLGNLAPQITQTLGLGAAFQELGLSAEISAGGVTNVMLTASKDTAGFAKQIGVTKQQFVELINNNPNEVLLKLADSLRGASNTEIQATLDGLNIKSQEAVKVVSLLANQTDFVRQKQALAAAEYTKGTSLLDEYAKKNSNAAAQVEKAEKSFASFRQELGDVLIPIYLRVLQLTGLLATVLREVPAFVAENKAAFYLLAVAVATYNAGLIATQVTMLRDVALRKLVALGIVIETKAKEEGAVATYSLATAQGAWNAALAANPIGIVVLALAAFAFGLKQLYDRSETFRAAVGSLWTMLLPVREAFSQLNTQLGAVWKSLAQLIGGADGSQKILAVLGQVVAVQVIVPLKLLVAYVQFAVDALGVLVDVGQTVANFFHRDFTIETGAFDRLTQHVKDNANSIGTTLLGQDKALADQSEASDDERRKRHEEKVQAALKRSAEFQRSLRQQQQEAAQADSVEKLKAQEAELRAALALVANGSAEELRLKKALVVVKRDIDLLGEKKTEGDRKVIRAEAQRDLAQLDKDFAKKQADEAAKRAKEEADVQKKIADLKAGLIKDETERKIAQLTAAAEREKALAKGTAAQVAEQRRLLDDKLAVDVAAERKTRADKELQTELGIEKLRNSLIKDEFNRKDAEIVTAHKEALAKLNKDDAHYNDQVQALEDTKEKGLADNNRNRVAAHRAMLEAIAAMDRDHAVEAADKDANDPALGLGKRLKAADAALALRREQLAADRDAELSNENLTQQQKDAIRRDYDQRDRDAAKDTAKFKEELRKQEFENYAAVATASISAITDLNKVQTDREVAGVANAKKSRLALLESEYKSGALNKDKYEAQKASIEQSYDEKTRAVKRKAAEDEKAYAIAQAIIQTALAVVKAAPVIPLQIAAGITGAASIAKIIATPIPEFEQGGVFSRAWRGVKQYARGGRHINPVAGVAEAGQRHSNGGIRMVDGATGEHLGEWERGEAYMILSRTTYANNKHLVDELIDTSLYRGGAPVRRQSGHFEDGGTFTTGRTPAGASAAGQAQADGRELVQLLRETRDAIRALPDRQFIGWGREDTAELEQRLDEREADRQRGSVR